MANLSTFSMLKERVNKYKQDYMLNKNSLAFVWLGLETILNLNEDEIEDSVTDGPMDGGIDAIYIEGTNVHVFNFKYTEKFQNTKSNFPATELSKILTTMHSIYDRTTKEKEVNAVLWNRVCEIWDLFDRGGTINFKYYLCSNMENPISVEKNRFEQALEPYKFVEFCYINQEDFVSKILEKKYKKVDGDITFVEKQYFQRSDGALKGIVGTLEATDLINLVKNSEDKKEINEHVFNENVRTYLKLKNRVNRSIYETALSDCNHEFWYLNNGITIVCEECTYNPSIRSPRLKLKNLQIVNGGQTTHALFEAYLKDPEKVRDILVLVRICEIKKDYSISEKISETTNSQTPVRTRDLHANDRVQKKLEEEFMNLGYYYERKKNQHINKQKEKRLDNELLGQIYMAYYLDMPSEAKNNKRLVFSDKYDTIFDEDKITAARALIPHRFFIPLEKEKKKIQAKKRKKEKISEKDAYMSRAIFHLLNTCKIITKKQGKDSLSAKDVDKTIKKAIKYVGDVVKIESKKRGEGYTHDKFFKEIPTNKIISDYVEKKCKVHRVSS